MPTTISENIFALFKFHVSLSNVKRLKIKMKKVIIFSKNLNFERGLFYRLPQHIHVGTL